MGGGVCNEWAWFDPLVEVGEDTRRVRDAWEQHHQRLWRSVLAWSGDADVASDAVAEAFAQCLRRGDEVRDVAAWVWRAAFRIAAGMLADARQAVPVAGGVPIEGRQVDGLRVAAVEMPHEVVELTGALARLSDDDRTVVVLALVGGWPAADIARFTGRSAGAVRVRLHRARRQLIAWLEDDDD
jgi:RNA polymerase sigma-70 factor (ECF subfamily)